MNANPKTKILALDEGPERKAEELGNLLHDLLMSLSENRGKVVYVAMQNIRTNITAENIADNLQKCFEVGALMAATALLTQAHVKVRND